VPTLALDKAVADHYPYLVEVGIARGAEFIAHGVSRRRIIHTGMSDDEERCYIQESVAAVTRATGHRPMGWLGPDFQETQRTPNLLAECGLRYLCDWGNDEQPYRMTAECGRLISLGVNGYLDDSYIHLYGRRTIVEVNRMWRDWFDGIYAAEDGQGRVMVLNLHPWIMGQPWRIKYLDDVLHYITSHPDLWIATGSQIVDWFDRQTPQSSLESDVSWRPWRDMIQNSAHNCKST
jgi:peptidoglycan/xylan/chitin deacetylase (PgdA/CDA1 family)